MNEFIKFRMEDAEDGDIWVECYSAEESTDELHGLIGSMKERIANAAAKTIDLSFQPIKTVGTAIIRKVRSMPDDLIPDELEAELQFEISKEIGLHLVAGVQVKGGITVKMIWKNPKALQ